MFRRLAEIAGEYLRKGSQVYLEGKLKTRKWQDKNGNDRYTTEIEARDMQMLGSKSSGGQSFQAPQAAPAANHGPEDSLDGVGGAADQDIPFSPLRGLV